MLTKHTRPKRRQKVATKIGTFTLAAITALAMCIPATAFAYNGQPTANNFYGMNTSKQIGENTAPSAANGDKPFNLEELHNTDVVAGSGGAGTAIQDYMDVLGAHGIGTSGWNWGTKINIAPNAFAWNDILYTSEDDVTCSQVSQGGDPTDPAAAVNVYAIGNGADFGDVTAYEMMPTNWY